MSHPHSEDALNVKLTRVFPKQHIEFVTVGCSRFGDISPRHFTAHSGPSRVAYKTLAKIMAAGEMNRPSSFQHSSERRLRSMNCSSTRICPSARSASSYRIFTEIYLLMWERTSDTIHASALKTSKPLWRLKPIQTLLRLKITSTTKR